MLHTDGKDGKTTGGTRQDTCNIWHAAYMAAFSAFVEVINECAKEANVHCLHCPSNHDEVVGLCLSHAIETHFKADNRVTFDVSPSDRKYVKFGKTILAFTHGDGAKEADLLQLGTTEARLLWGDAERIKWFVHHLHHKIKAEYLGKKKVLMEKDYGSTSIISTGIQSASDCSIEYARSISATDAWHHKKGYQHSPKMIEAWVFDENGEEDKLVSVVR